MPSRTFTVAAAVVSTAVLATGITYASTDRSTQAEPATERAEQPAHRAAPPARQAAPAPAPSAVRAERRARGTRGTRAATTRAPTAAGATTRTAAGAGATTRARTGAGATAATTGRRRRGSTSTNGSTPPIREAASLRPAGWDRAASASTTTAGMRSRSFGGSPVTAVLRSPRSAPTAAPTVS